METGKAEQETTVQIKRTFNASREKVYNAWTRTEELSRWFAPSNEYETIVDQLDVREGGKYRIIMKHPNAVHTVTGEYLQVQPPGKLVYTWRWEEKSPVGETSQVTIEFLDRGKSTEVVLTHERLVSEEERKEHSHGWNGCLDQLQQFLNAENAE